MIKKFFLFFLFGHCKVKCIDSYFFWRYYDALAKKNFIRYLKRNKVVLNHPVYIVKGNLILVGDYDIDDYVKLNNFSSNIYAHPSNVIEIVPRDKLQPSINKNTIIVNNIIKDYLIDVQEFSYLSFYFSNGILYIIAVLKNTREKEYISNIAKLIKENDENVSEVIIICA